jgi:hypothetical protein
MLERLMMLFVFTNPLAYTLDTLIGAVCVEPDEKNRRFSPSSPTSSAPYMLKIPACTLDKLFDENPIIPDLPAVGACPKFSDIFAPSRPAICTVLAGLAGPPTTLRVLKDKFAGTVPPPPPPDTPVSPAPEAAYVS